MLNYREAMEYIKKVSTSGSVYGLDTMTELLRRLKNPEDALKFVHIAGTNGKGSTAAFISSILACSGYKVGRYLSPVLWEYREKIQIQTRDKCEYIKEEAVARYLFKIKEVADTMVSDGISSPTSFEIETAMAFLEFAESGCDIVVLEVGLGGREDATNVIKNVECAVITAVSMDHMDFLGNSLEKIAKEKAGIIKPECYVVSYDQEDNKDYKEYPSHLKGGMTVSEVISQACKEKNAILTMVSFDNIQREHHDLNGITFDYKNLKELKINLLGKCQVKNAVVAIEAVRVLCEKGFVVNTDAIYRGLLNTRWQGRFDIIRKEPLVIVDGAHNEGAARSLAESIQIYLKGKPLVLVVGVLKDKDYNTILKYTAGYGQIIITITPENSRGLPSSQLKETAKKYCSCVMDAGNLSKGLKMAEKLAEKGMGILIFGSLSFLGDVYAFYSGSETSPLE